MSASHADRQRSRAVEISCECESIAREVERLVAADNEMVERECQVHALMGKRLAQLRKEQRELSGLLDRVQE